MDIGQGANMGLKSEDLQELDLIGLKPSKHRRRRIAELRSTYEGDPVALRQIDVYDIGSPYSLHNRAYLNALRTGDEETRLREETWIREHYPDIE